MIELLTAFPWPGLNAPKRMLLARLGGSAPRSGLTQALTGTTLAARTKEDRRLHDDFGSMGYLKGCVRCRTLRLGMTAHAFAGVRSTAGFGVIE